MKNFTNKFIAELISCEKAIIDPPSRDFKQERGHLKKNFTLQSVDGEYNFNVFIRCSLYFQENFSIGLDYSPKEEKRTICLIRCNGTHGESLVFPHHSVFHIHRANAETINSGLKSESIIEQAYDYASLEEAIQFFVKYINITLSDRNKYFFESDSQFKLDL